jgi:hypothetical protein
MYTNDTRHNLLQLTPAELETQLINVMTPADMQESIDDDENKEKIASFMAAHRIVNTVTNISSDETDAERTIEDYRQLGIEGVDSSTIGLADRIVKYLQKNGEVVDIPKVFGAAIAEFNHIKEMIYSEPKNVEHTATLEKSLIDKIHDFERDLISLEDDGNENLDDADYSKLVSHLKQIAVSRDERYSKSKIEFETNENELTKIIIPESLTKLAFKNGNIILESKDSFGNWVSVHEFEESELEGNSLVINSELERAFGYRITIPTSGDLEENNVFSEQIKFVTSQQPYIDDINILSLNKLNAVPKHEKILLAKAVNASSWEDFAELNSIAEVYEKVNEIFEL